MISLLEEPIDLSARLHETVSLEGKTLYVCHASYEKRAYGATDHNLTGLSIAYSCVIGTTKSIERNLQYKTCFEDLTIRLTNISATAPVAINVSRDSLISMVKHFDAIFGTPIRQEIENIVIDSSVFPKDRLWMIVDYIKRVNNSLRLYILYSEPEHYNTETQPEGWLSKGVKRLIPIPGFNGQQSSEKQTLLILIVGHEEERMQITIRNTEPDKVILVGQGAQQYSDDSPRLSDFIAQRLGHDYGHVIDFSETYSAGSRDYLAVRSAIKTIFRHHNEDYNIVVAANSTKLQSIGALLACQEHQEITAIYAEPQIYNSEMSYGRGKIWGFRIS